MDGAAGGRGDRRDAAHRPQRLRPPSCRGVLAAACVAAACLGGRAVEALELVSSDISWRSCAANFTDALFPSVCQGGGEGSIGVTVSATWLEAAGSAGPALLQAGGVVVTRGLAPEYYNKLGWVSESAPSELHELPYDVVGTGGADSGYKFAIVHDGLAQDQTVQTRYSFQFDVQPEGDYRVYFEGCCRWSMIKNPGSSPSTSIPWHISATVPVHPNSSHHASVSPVVSMPPVQLVRGTTPGALSFILTGAGVLLTSVLTPGVSIEGKYTAYPPPNAKMYLDGGMVLRAGGDWTAFLRDDGLFSVLWFQSPDMTPQFQSTRALAFGPSWVVVRGDVRSRVGLRPAAAAAGDAVAHAIGGVWGEMGGGMDAGIPSYLPGAIEMSWTGLQGQLAYLNKFSVQAVGRQSADPPPPSMPPPLTFRLGTSMDMGGMHTQIDKYLVYRLDQAAGLEIDPTYGVMTIPVDLPAGTYVTTVLVSSGHATVPTDFWITVLAEDASMEFPMPAYGPSWPFTSAHAPVQLTCGQSTTLSPSFKTLTQAAPAAAAARATFLSDGMVFTAGAAGAFTLAYTPVCGTAYHRALVFGCVEALFPMAGGVVGRKSVPRGCVYYNVTDPSWPPAEPVVDMNMTKAPITTTASVVMTTPPPVKEPLRPPVVLPSSTEDPQEQLKKGYVDIQYQGDLRLIPDTAYVAKFNVGGLCVGGRDMGMQTNVTRAWNMLFNDEDAPTRGIYYDLGPELNGTVVNGTEANLGEELYLWTCVQPRRYFVALARAAELTEVDGVGCLFCWSPMGH